MTDSQSAADQLLGQIKQQIMLLLNETADEFDAMDLTDDQRRVYNDFTGRFGQKVLSIKVSVE